ncbi:MAG: cytochrome c [Gammaproteobacteria bacterium]
MIRNISTMIAGAALGGLGISALAADATAGKALHEQHCIACHKRLTDGEPASLYTREARMVTSLDGLGSQVRRCEQTLELRWFEEDIENVVTYLNETYYHFDP